MFIVILDLEGSLRCGVSSRSQQGCVCRAHRVGSVSAQSGSSAWAPGCPKHPPRSRAVLTALGKSSRCQKTKKFSFADFCPAARSLLCDMTVVIKGLWASSLNTEGQSCHSSCQRPRFYDGWFLSVLGHVSPGLSRSTVAHLVSACRSITYPGSYPALLFPSLILSP